MKVYGWPNKITNFEMEFFFFFWKVLLIKPGINPTQSNLICFKLGFIRMAFFQWESNFNSSKCMNLVFSVTSYWNNNVGIRCIFLKVQICAAIRDGFPETNTWSWESSQGQDWQPTCSFSVGTTEVEPSATRHFPSDSKQKDLPRTQVG